jgi:hypothetical protein
MLEIITDISRGDWNDRKEVTVDIMQDSEIDIMDRKDRNFQYHQSNNNNNNQREVRLNLRGNHHNDGFREIHRGL